MNKNDSFNNRIERLLTSLSLILPLALGKAQAKMLRRELKEDIHSCLDVGCGQGHFKYLKQFDLVGCDIHQPALLENKKRGYCDNLVKCDAVHLSFKPKSFDAVISMELLEHLNKADSLVFLKQVEQVARKRVIITTPWGYYPQKDIAGNPYQDHISGWLPQELQTVGYRTYPFYCSRFPKGNKTPDLIIRYIFTLLFYPLTRLFPEHFAQDFVAIKEME